MSCDYDMVNESSSSLGVSVTTVESYVMKLTKQQSVSKCHVEVKSTYDESVTSKLSVAFTEHNLMGTHNTRREQTAVHKLDVGLLDWHFKMLVWFQWLVHIYKFINPLVKTARTNQLHGCVERAWCIGVAIAISIHS